MNRKIMVVDDDVPTLEVMKLLLPRIGWTPIIVNNGNTALDILEEERPALILLDVMMAPMSGWDFLDELRERSHLQDIPVMLFTAKHIWPEEYARYAEDLAGVLEKPVLPAELKKALERFARSGAECERTNVCGA
jgi:CheY-like chemotaxis protein